MNRRSDATDEVRSMHRIRFVRMPDRTAAVQQTIILAAGVGARLGRSGSGVPKPLMRVGGVPLVAHALAHASLSGCREAIVVIGHEGARVREAVEALDMPIAVRFVTNPDPTTPNGESLLVAEPLAATRFFLQMVDHVFAEPVLGRLGTALNGAAAGCVLIDRAPVNLDLSDATKVRLAGDRVTAIGKGIDAWDAIDAGCFVLTRSIFGALREVPAGEARTVSAAMRRLVARRALGAADLAGVRWIDVDTPDDHVEAEALLSAAHAVSTSRARV
jgi:choline kinase